MNDNQQQQNQQNQQMAAFGGSLPFTNVPAPQKKDDLAEVVYGPTPEGQSVTVEKPEAAKQTESAPEVQKAPENKPEKVLDIEKKEVKQYYPQNQQQQPKQQQTQAPAQAVKPLANTPKFFGYMVSPQIANNFAVISSLKGKGDVNKSRTWIYMLLDRILKKQSYAKKHTP
jgi:hypothetical protein